MRAGLDGVVKRSELQLGNEGNDEPHRMIRGHQLVEVDHLPAKAGAVGSVDTPIARVHAPGAATGSVVGKSGNKPLLLIAASLEHEAERITPDDRVARP